MEIIRSKFFMCLICFILGICMINVCLAGDYSNQPYPQYGGMGSFSKGQVLVIRGKHTTKSVQTKESNANLNLKQRDIEKKCNDLNFKIKGCNKKYKKENCNVKKEFLRKDANKDF